MKICQKPLLHYLRQDFFKASRNSNHLDGSINLLGLADWLEERLKTSLNPMAEITTPIQVNQNSTIV